MSVPHPLHNSIDYMIRMVHSNLSDQDRICFVSRVEQLVAHTATIPDFLHIISTMGKDAVSMPGAVQDTLRSTNVSDKTVSSTLQLILDCESIIRATASESELENAIKLVSDFFDAILFVIPTCRTLETARLFITQRIFNNRVVAGFIADKLKNLSVEHFKSEANMQNFMCTAISKMVGFLPVAASDADVELIRGAMENEKVCATCQQWMESITRELDLLCEV